MAKRIYKTARGRAIDVDAMLLKNEKKIAVGNANLNTRGDKIGPGGKIVKSKEQIANEYYRANPNAVKHDKE